MRISFKTGENCNKNLLQSLTINDFIPVNLEFGASGVFVNGMCLIWWKIGYEVLISDFWRRVIESLQTNY